MQYAIDRKSKFGKIPINFPRVSFFLNFAMMAVEIMIGVSAHSILCLSEKDVGRRCDVEGGHVQSCLGATWSPGAAADKRSAKFTAATAFALEYRFSASL